MTELQAGWYRNESWWGRESPPIQTGPGAHPASCTMGTDSFPGVEAAGAWGWPPHPHLVPKVLEKSRAIPLLTLRACVAYTKGENLHCKLTSNVICVAKWMNNYNEPETVPWCRYHCNMMQVSLLHKISLQQDAHTTASRWRYQCNMIWCWNGKNTTNTMQMLLQHKADLTVP